LWYLVKTPAIYHYNYWSPLACHVEEQEEPEFPPHKKEKLPAILPGPSNKISAHWARKIANRKARTGILDTGATSGAGRPEDAEFFEYMGQPSTKMFMLPDKSRVRATHKMLLKHKIRDGVREMNMVPGLQSTLVSVPKMVDEDYIVVFDKKSAKTCDTTTTTISASEKPILEAPRCTSTGLWLMPLEADGNKENDGHHCGNIERDKTSNIGGVSERANTIFELPTTRQTILYHHASAGFPVKETFLDAVRSGNYATWPGLTVTALHKYFPDSDGTQEGHMKGQHQGIRFTKQKALDHLVESEKIAKIKVKPGTRCPYRQNASTTYSSASRTWPRASTLTKQVRSRTPHSKAIDTSW